MNKERIDGTAREAKGAVKDAAGKIIGSKKLQAEGKLDKAAGKAENLAGKVKDRVRDNEKEDQREEERRNRHSH